MNTYKRTLLLAVVFFVGSITASVEVVAENYFPFDATTTANANKVYFVGTNAQGVSAIYKTGPHGGAITTVKKASDICNPCTFKNSVVISNDDKTLFTIVVSGAARSVVAINESTGAARVLHSTTAFCPRGLSQGLNGNVYFTGNHSGRPGLFRVHDDGTELQVIAIGGPFENPDGVAVNAANSVAYITDSGKLIRVKIASGDVDILLRRLSLGNPAGIALSLDETRVLMSAVDPTGHCEVKIFDGEAGSLVSFNDTIGQNTACGGVHRAHLKDSFAWADLQGRVYMIRL